MWTKAGIVLFFAWACTGHGQATQPVFNAASLKIAHRPSPPDSLQMKGGPGTGDPGRVTRGVVQLQTLLLKAYGFDFENYRVVGPSWMSGAGSEQYSLVATMPPETTRRPGCSPATSWWSPPADRS